MSNFLIQITVSTLCKLENKNLNFVFRLNWKRLEENADHISPLQSWGPEIQNFRSLPRRPIIEGDCDVVVEKPTYIMKIDASK